MSSDSRAGLHLQMLDANDLRMLIATTMQIRSILEQFMDQMVIVNMVTNMRKAITCRYNSGSSENSFESFRYGNHIVEVVRITQNVVPFIHVDETKFVVYNLWMKEINFIGAATRFIHINVVPLTGTFGHWSSIS